MTFDSDLDLRQSFAERGRVVCDREDDRAGARVLPSDGPIRKALVHPQCAVGAAIKANYQAPSMDQVTFCL